MTGARPACYRPGRPMSPSDPKTAAPPTPATDFIRQMVQSDLRAGRYPQVVTRFPPEPNGYLHIGHAKSICLNFGVAAEYGGVCHLRFDDTNPVKEDTEYVRSIQDDVRWLGFDWGDKLFYASSYFGRLYEYAVRLVEMGKAYVDSLDEAAIREYRGTVTEPGRPSPYRDRSVQENLELLERMKAGDFPDGAHVLRLKGDLAAANMKMRDPLIYRIRHAHHHQTGDDWCIYPLYDYAHCLSDYIEGITHSLCTLEFENNRDLYDGFIEALELPPPRPFQTEFARLNLTYTVLSKRKLLELVKGRHLAGWDDPRMPTIAGYRRRGYTASAIRAFAEKIGVAKANSTVDIGLLEHTIREELNETAPRAMAVLDPIELVITSWPEGEVETLEAPCFPDDTSGDPARAGTRRIPFGRRLWIEREDFAVEPPAGWHRLAPGAEVRLRSGYFVTCTGFETDADGAVVRVLCTHDPETRGGAAPDGRRPKGTIHWVSAEHAIEAEVRLYDRLFTEAYPEADPDVDWRTLLNPDSLVVRRARLEPSLAEAAPGHRFQFERLGYFIVDPVDAAEGRRAYNRVVGLKDSWARQVRSAAPARSEPRRPKAPVPAPAKGPAPLGPEARALVDAHGIGEEEARAIAAQAELVALLEGAVAAGAPARPAANWIANELVARMKGREAALPFDGAALGALVRLVDAGAINTTAGKEVLDEMLASGAAPADIVAARGLEQVDDAAALTALVGQVLAENADAVARYREGKTNLMGFFVGQVMKASGGKAKPATVRSLLEQALQAV